MRQWAKPAEPRPVNLAGLVAAQVRRVRRDKLFDARQRLVEVQASLRRLDEADGEKYARSKTAIAALDDLMDVL